MAELLGSLLPADYTAPNVEDILAGDLWVTCKSSGDGPVCTKPKTCWAVGG